MLFLPAATACQHTPAVKPETFSDQWHVRVYSQAARTTSRSSLFKEDCLVKADSSHLLEELLTLLEYSRHGMCHLLSPIGGAGRDPGPEDGAQARGRAAARGRERGRPM